jgi:3'-phosphoadenosine 5'-phosphosulfate sulfotransferase (PAPS reductase)/FAD synthetase
MTSLQLGFDLDIPEATAFDLGTYVADPVFAELYSEWVAFLDRAEAELGDLNRWESVRRSSPDKVERLRYSDAQRKLYEKGKALSLAMFNAAFAAAPENALFVVGTSTGKDSSMMVGWFIEWMDSRKDAGRPTPEVLMVSADTRAEMPGMSERVVREMALLDAYGKKQGFNLSTNITEPEVDDRLLVELVGNGRPLPELGRIADPTMNPIGSWCADRVKHKPIAASMKKLMEKKRPLVYLLGVRSDESTMRAKSIEKTGSGLPYGISRLGSHAIDKAVALTPIVDIPNWGPWYWAQVELAPWNALSGLELQRIYDLAADDGDRAADIGECGLRSVAGGGGLTATCKNLDGLRMGCFYCLKSVNRTLHNMVRREGREKAAEGKQSELAPLAKFDLYLKNLHKRRDIRSKMRDNFGFDHFNFIDKSLLFRERYFILMAALRAEYERRQAIRANYGTEWKKHIPSPIITKEEMDAIERAWIRVGVTTVKPREAIRDMHRWRRADAGLSESEKHLAWTPETARFSFEEVSANLDSLGHYFNEGLPRAATQHLRLGRNPLATARLLAFREYGEPVMPILRSYVFRHVSEPRQIVLITDFFGAIATRTEKGLFDQIALENYELEHVRPLTAFERSISDDRMVIFEYNRGAHDQMEATLLDLDFERTKRQELGAYNPDYLLWGRDQVEGDIKSGWEHLWKAHCAVISADINGNPGRSLDEDDEYAFRYHAAEPNLRPINEKGAKAMLHLVYRLQLLSEDLNAFSRDAEKRAMEAFRRLLPGMIDEAASSCRARRVASHKHTDEDVAALDEAIAEIEGARDNPVKILEMRNPVCGVIRNKFSALARQAFGIDGKDSESEFLTNTREFERGLACLAKAIRRGFLSVGRIERLLYLSNMAAVDPVEAERLWDEFLTTNGREFMEWQEARLRSLEERLEAKHRERESRQNVIAA